MGQLLLPNDRTATMVHLVIVYDNNAYAITLIYHDGHLKMYTGYLAQSASPECRPEY